MEHRSLVFWNLLGLCTAYTESRTSGPTSYLGYHETSEGLVQHWKKLWDYD